MKFVIGVGKDHKPEDEFYYPDAGPMRRSLIPRIRKRPKMAECPGRRKSTHRRRKHPRDRVKEGEN